MRAENLSKIEPREFTWKNQTVAELPVSAVRSLVRMQGLSKCGKHACETSRANNRLPSPT